MPPRISTVPRAGLLLPLGAAAVVLLSLSAGWWLGQQSAGASRRDHSRQSLKDQVDHLESRIAAGRASMADQQRLLELLIALGEQRQATALLEQMSDRQPERWQLRLLLAELRRNGNDRSGAERELRQLLTLQPDRIEALQLLALLQLEQGRGGQAQTQLQTLLAKASKPELQPQALPIGLLLADLQQRMGQTPAAAGIYSQLATAFPKDPRPLLGLALLRQQQGDSRGAQEVLALARGLQGEAAGRNLDALASAWGLSNLRQRTATSGSGVREPSEPTPGSTPRAGGPALQAP